MPGRIVLATFGSLGDLNPFLAIGSRLRERGHEVAVATSEFYRERVESRGLGFRPVRPDLSAFEADPGVMARAMDLRHGTEFIVRQVVLPALRGSYEDLLAAAGGADLLVSHPLTYAVPMVAEKRGIRWASAVLQPLGFLSVLDPPILPAAPVLWKLRRLGPGAYASVLRLLRWALRSWSDPVHRLRAEVGLPPVAEPTIEGMLSPLLVLALFSSLLARRQADWPRQTVVAGFPFLDEDAGLPDALQRFLDAGPPPVVFTLGSSAVMDAGRFYEHGAEAARLLGRRAVLLVGPDPRNRPRSLADGVIAVEYAPFSALFPRAGVLVHQGGIGTTGEAMRAGRPMLVVPFAHDQPDNAERLRRLGIARVVPRRRYEPRRVAAELGRLLEDPSCAEKAAAVGAGVRGEDGVRAACEALERLLAWRRGLTPEIPRSRAEVLHCRGKHAAAADAGRLSGRRDAMAFKIRRIDYFYATVDNQPGEGYELLSQLAGLGINLLAFTAVPVGPTRTQLALFPEDPGRMTDAARKAGLVLDGPHRALLVQGDDELGAVAGIHTKLHEANAHVYASSCVTDGRGSYGYVLYIRPDEYERAVKALQV